MVHAIRCEQNVQTPAVYASVEKASIGLERAIGTCARDRYTRGMSFGSPPGLCSKGLPELKHYPLVVQKLCLDVATFNGRENVIECGSVCIVG